MTLSSRRQCFGLFMEPFYVRLIRSFVAIVNIPLLNKFYQNSNRNEKEGSVTMHFKKKQVLVHFYKRLEYKYYYKRIN